MRAKNGETARSNASATRRSGKTSGYLSEKITKAKFLMPVVPVSNWKS